MDDKQPLLKESTQSYGGTLGSTTNAAPPGGPPLMGSLPGHPLPPQPTSGGQGDPPPPPPSAPPESMVETVSGYEGITFNPGNYVAPPSYDEALLSSPTGSSDAPPPPPQTHVTERQARDSLLQLAGQRFCWGKKAAQDMVISSITSSSAFHYQLETFTEARKSVWTFEPYYGGAVDGPFNGAAPTPWSIPIQPEQMFRNHEKSCEVPHTAFVKPCHDCTGTGMKRCHNCNGSGRAICNVCRGSGYQSHLHVDNHHHHHHHHHDHHHHRHHHSNVHTDITLCHHCAGTGHKLCWICSGHGQVNCNTCNSKGQLRCFIKLIVIWTVHSNDHIIESVTLPDELVRDAGGQIAFQESSVRVAPVGHFPNSAVNTASQRLVQQHNTAFPNEKILMQRHKVRIIPISEVQGDYSSKVFTFWVYGTENISYAPDYPQQCCCGCTIL